MASKKGKADPGCNIIQQWVQLRVREVLADYSLEEAAHLLAETEAQHLTLQDMEADLKAWAK